MAHSQYSQNYGNSYSNGHSNYTDEHNNAIRDDLFHYPMDIPWSANWQNAASAPELPTDSIISKDVIRELRQHAKALEHNFDFNTTGDDPAYEKVSDTEVDSGTLVDQETFNEGSDPSTTGRGLLDGLEKIGLSDIQGVSTGETITKAKIDEIAQKIKTTSEGYSNYSNVFDEGYNKYVNHGNYANYTRNSSHYNYANQHSQTFSCHTQTYGKSHSNYSRGSGSNPAASYKNTTINQPAEQTYSNVYDNPAIYNNTL